MLGQVGLVNIKLGWFGFKLFMKFGQVQIGFQDKFNFLLVYKGRELKMLSPWSQGPQEDQPWPREPRRPSSMSKEDLYLG